LSSRACAAAAVFAIYVATAARDVGGPGLDSAKFGYMSRILGVPHPPGYPLYMVVGWLWSWLPIGSLMFRMSVLSGACGAASVWLVAVFLELVGCASGVAALVALLAGLGRIFWSQSVIPEVYTLHTALLLASLVSLVAWKRSGNPRQLYLASFAFGLDLAHHTDVAVFAPAILVFVAAVSPRSLISPRVVATCAALVLTPMVLYLYIIVRTNQGAPYVEAGATTISGLIDVISGRQFGYLLFRGGMLDAIRDRSVSLGRFFQEEMGWWGSALALAGFVVLWRRDRAASLLVGLGALGMLTFVLNYYPPDIEVFLLPVFLMCWVGIGTAVDAMGRVDRRAYWPAAAVLVVWVCWQLGANAEANNLRQDSYDARMLNRLFQDMPDESAIVGDTIDVSQAILYKLFAEPAVAARRPTLVVPGEFGATRVFGFVRGAVPGDPSSLDRLVAERPAVYAFARLADPLRAQGFRLDPIRLRDRPLEDYLAALDGHSIVAAALPPHAAARLFANGRNPLARIGVEVRSIVPGECLALIGAAGDRRGAVASAGAVGRAAIRKGDPVGALRRPAPADVVVECGPAAASISVGGREVAASETGVPVVVLDQAGEVVDQTLASPSMDFDVPFEWRWQPIYRVAAPRRCATIGQAVADVTKVASQAGLAISLPNQARANLLVGSDGPLRVRAGQFSRRPASLHAVPAGPPDGHADVHAEIWTRVAIAPESSGQDDVIDVVLGAQPRVVFASLDRDTPGGSVCEVTLGNFPVLAGTLDGAERVVADGSREEIFADGWEAVEQDEHGGFRWARSRRAHVLPPMALVSDIRVSVRARRPPGAGPCDAIGLIVNGRPYPPLAMVDGWGTYAWHVGQDAWRDGVNDVAIESPRLAQPPGQTSDARLLGVAVRELVFRIADPAIR